MAPLSLDLGLESTEKPKTARISLIFLTNTHIYMILHEFIHEIIHFLRNRFSVTIICILKCFEVLIAGVTKFLVHLFALQYRHFSNVTEICIFFLVLGHHL